MTNNMFAKDRRMIDYGGYMMDNTDNIKQSDELQNQNAVSESESENVEGDESQPKTEEETDEKIKWPDEQDEEQVVVDKTEIKEEKPKKNMKLVMIIAAIAIAIIAAFTVVPSLMTPDLSKMEPTEDMKINSMSFKIPEGCKEEKSKGDSYYLYSINKNDRPIGVIEVEYKGDTDLEGDGGYDLSTVEHKKSDNAMKLIPEAKGAYQTVESDNSAFAVTVYADDKKVKGKDALASAIANTFDKSGYSNPRENDGIRYSYKGDTSDGVVIDNDVKRLEVWEVFITSLGAGRKSTTFSVDESVKLEAGKTSAIHITLANGSKHTIDIKCSDDAPYYKNGKFVASFDKIMAKYIVEYSDIRLMGSSTSARAELDLYKKDDAYGGQMHSYTDRDFTMVFCSFANDGETQLAANKKPGNILVMIQTDKDEEVEDMMCFVSAFANLLCTLNTDIDQDEAFDAVKNTVTDGTEGQAYTYGGVKYRYTDEPGMYLFKVEG